MNLSSYVFEAVAAAVLVTLGLIGGWTANSALSGESAPTPSGKGFTQDTSSLKAGELLTGMPPSGGIVYKPDTTKGHLGSDNKVTPRIDTFAVTLPTFIRDTTYINTPERDYTSNLGLESPDIQLGDITRRRYLNFLALPIKNGAPTLRVTPDMVIADMYDPQDGRGITMRWDVPSYDNKIGFKGGASTTISDATILSANPTLFYKRNNYRLDVGYRLSNRSIFQGVTVSLSFEKVLFRF